MDAIGDSAHVSSLSWLRSSSSEFDGRQLIVGQQEFLLEKLAAHMRGLCGQDIPCSSGLFDCHNFFGNLREEFDVGIYNLNYDTVAKNAWPEAFMGFDSLGNFDPLAVAQRKEWGFMYHLHGSVHHSIDRIPARPWIVWKGRPCKQVHGHWRTAC